MKKVEENKQHDAFAEMFIEELQIIKRQPNQKEKESHEDPLVLFAYWILLPLFFASITVLAIVIFNMLFGS
ncbi:MAG: hypothetical protein CL609_13365 [Anaerolineaceae bacterium]|nr:hypothetical protein [Anaerolineaceae bacterium]